MDIYCAPRHDRGGSEAVYSLLEYVFTAKSYGKTLPEIEKTPNGKPYFPARPDIHFSLSHTKTHVLCALSDKPVGVDIESPRHISARAIGYFCLPEELAQFDPLDLWVIKESYIKLLGATLPAVKDLRFSRDGGVIVAPDETAVVKLYRFGERDGGCRAAVSTFGGEPPDVVSFYLPR